MLGHRNWICKDAGKVGEEGGKSGSQYQREKGRVRVLELQK